MRVGSGRDSCDDDNRGDDEDNLRRRTESCALGQQGRSGRAADDVTGWHHPTMLVPRAAGTGIVGSGADARHGLHLRRHGGSRRNLTGHPQREGQEQHQNPEPANERAQHAQTT